MQTTNPQFMEEAKAVLSGKWKKAIAFSSLYLAAQIIMDFTASRMKEYPWSIEEVFSSSLNVPESMYIRLFSAALISTFAGFLLQSALHLSKAHFALGWAREEDISLGEVLTKGFKKLFSAALAHFLIILFSLLWALLLIVPGIIAAVSYSQTFFILAEEPSLGAREALGKSKSMMEGWKWQYLCLSFRFLGWAILCLITAGIGFLWLIPYASISYANFYEAVKSSRTEGEEDLAGTE